MASVKQLESQLREVTQLLEAYGIRLPSKARRDPTDRVDYVEPGSERHMIFLGLIEVEDAKEAVEEYGYTVYRSKKTDKTYRLEDPVTPFMQYPDPIQVARLVLAQKVSSLESGPVRVPADAPSLLRYDRVRV